jgi:hypothetical protein
MLASEPNLAQKCTAQTIEPPEMTSQQGEFSKNQNGLRRISCTNMYYAMIQG